MDLSPKTPKIDILGPKTVKNDLKMLKIGIFIGFEATCGIIWNWIDNELAVWRL